MKPPSLVSRSRVQAYFVAQEFYTARAEIATIEPRHLQEKQFLDTKLFAREGKIFIASKFARMRQVLSTFKEQWKIFLAVAAILSLQLISAGQLGLCGAVLIGALLNFFYFLSTAARLEAAAKSSAPQAKKIMLIGLLMRLVMVFAILAVAVHISTPLFLASAVSFGVFYLTTLFVLARSEVRKKF